MGWRDKKRRREEAEKATRDAARYSKGVKPLREGRGLCRICLTTNGHTSDCSRNS
jgi:hypothetical protein